MPRLLQRNRAVSAWALFGLILVAQTSLAVLVLTSFNYPIGTQRDSGLYIRITDNVLAGNGFSSEPTSPWRPEADRTPGFLLTNLPLRAAFGSNDLASVVAGRLWLIGAALLAVALARELGLSGPDAAFAAPILICFPTVAYYSVTVFETEIPYLIAWELIGLGLLRALRGKSAGLAILFFGSAYAMLLRPAVLPPAIGTTALVLALAARKSRRTSRRVLSVGVTMAIGFLVPLTVWSYRNHVVLGSFSYSTVASYNLLEYNAAGMKPFLDPDSRSEVDDSLSARHYSNLRYYDSDQIVRADAHRREGMRLILKHPVAFVLSHLYGSGRTLLVFETPEIHRKVGTWACTGFALIQLALTVGGILGAAILWRTEKPNQRIVVAVLALAGILGVLVAGAIGSPRFRIPLEILLAIGGATLLSRWSHREILWPPATIELPSAGAEPVDKLVIRAKGSANRYESEPS